jgi:SNF2 family DNA or RNA helicase
VIKQRILEYSSKIKILEEKNKIIEERISFSDEECCFICADYYVMPTVVSCCNNVYCYKCLMEAISSVNKCPYCREPVSSKTFKVIYEDTIKNEKIIHQPTCVQYIESKKADAFTDILNHIRIHDVSPKILIFSDYSATLEHVGELVTQVGMTGKNLKGTPARINNILNAFDEGSLDILFLESGRIGSGMNLQSANYVILMHRMDKSTETQIIGRAQRFGRKKPLNVIYILAVDEQTDDFAQHPTCIGDINGLQQIIYEPELIE